ncbi:MULTISPECIES: hypothetical protein [unclassified Glutamicibacter]|uniref:hypothetical protein n=1 Tax=unclassified Glutamicibacter TaxID=2627139 RepID=UPI0038302F1D
MGKCKTCKDCGGKGYFDRSHLGKIPVGCRTCEGEGYTYRTGPYRLADGTWSDGVDRSKRIDLRQVTDRYEVTVRPGYFHVWHNSGQPAEFYSFAEAIAYADRTARTTKNGDNK